MKAHLFAGIGVLLQTTVAPAAVVVTQLPGHGFGLADGRYEVDIDGDGAWEVAFEASLGVVFSALTNTQVRIQAIPEPPPGINSDAVSLSEGSIVSMSPFAAAQWVYDPVGSTLRSCTDIYCVGDWPTTTYLSGPEPGPGVLILPDSGYLAVEFTNDTGLHYGWVDVGVLGFSPVGYIRGWGWETDSGTAVTIIPEPNCFLLLMFASTPVFFRQRKS